ncbi:sodium/hydrogen exchanger 8-like [Hydractinia symbiolongicarpus]|uniref:sodium/hydrogen exchanger 8-like n=1 Tax=Hydractinia symbiolongicarpus TaxID=13093 RepID=UPI00254A52DA|nr:sodium/hydrogen exchanger 8-like [Hydractinia symbiolongicarpus]
MGGAARRLVVFWLIGFFFILYCSARKTSPSLTIKGTSTKNGTLLGNLTTSPPSTTTPTEVVHKTAVVETAEEKEKHGSMTIFFVLSVLGLCIISIHILIKTKFAYLPESVAVVFLGCMIGAIIKLLQRYNLANWEKEELFDPTIFFLVLLPPIIFESGYNLHKGNFFANLGSIIVFAIFGTIISAVIVGSGIYFLGQAKITPQLDIRESFAFGSLISAVDPVATLAIFHALNADPLLNMLVFGESILNDAVAIVLTKAVLNSGTVFESVIAFIKIFFGSAGVGVAFALISALILKHVDLRQHPSLELGMMVVFSYAPYELAEGLQLSGIMAILFCGIVMSHYTHFNLSPVTQITVQHLFRTAAFVSETCVFAYLGMSIFSYSHKFEASFIIWSIVLCLIGRAANVFPLSFILNFFRETKIKRTNQLIMWFSGLRGAIAFALAINIEGFSEEISRLLVTTTLVIVLFTLLVLGGSTLPLLKCLKATRDEQVTLSKTAAEGSAVDAEQLTDDERRIHKITRKGFTKLDMRYLLPFFTRRITKQELRDAQHEMQRLTSQWYTEVRESPDTGSDQDEVEFKATSSLL